MPEMKLAEQDTDGFVAQSKQSTGLVEVIANGDYELRTGERFCGAPAESGATEIRTGYR
jgi:hypothetical protein